MLRRMMESRVYWLRLLAYAARGQAMVAVLKEPAVRRAVLPPEREPAAPAEVPAAAAVEAPAEADFVIVGSGASGATAAVVLAEKGHDVVVLEEGGWYTRPSFAVDLYGAMSRLFRDFGAQVARGPAVVPLLEGCCVGGSTVINGGIVHRLPRAVHDRWCDDAGIAAALPWGELERCAAALEAALGVRANLGAALPSLPAARVLERLGWRHQAMLRNAPGCQATGRCLQGCPSGGKLSMEASFVPRARAAGARICARHRVLSLLNDGRRATGVVVRTGDGHERAVRARRGVIVAAGAIRSPLLLRTSGVAGARCGQHLQIHLGVGSTALLPGPVEEVEGPPQGIEVLEFEREGIKLATQLLPPELRLVRAPAVGDELEELLRGCDRLSSWTGSVRAEAEGAVTPGRGGRPDIRFAPGRHDLERLREALARTAELQLALGATAVFPGVTVEPRRLSSVGDVARLRALPLDARAFWLSVGHMFGTCRMGTNPTASVVAPDFRVHGYDGLYVVDASVFPSNIGVNPQLAIMTLAMLAAERIASG
jgi:choline dehydrogenase-like flavoprotein